MSQAIDDAYHLAKMVCFTGNAVQTVFEKDKHGKVADIRHIIIYFLHVDFDWKVGRIANATDRHRRTIHNSIQRFRDLVESDSEFRDMAAEYRDMIHEGFLSLAAIA